METFLSEIYKAQKALERCTELAREINEVLDERREKEISIGDRNNGLQV